MPYLKNTFDYITSKYKAVIDPLLHKIQKFPEHKRTKYARFLVNLAAYLSVMSRIIEKEIKDLNISENDSDSDFSI